MREMGQMMVPWTTVEAVKLRSVVGFQVSDIKD